jgi:Spy/CpxP family protein refolding chaperone
MFGLIIGTLCLVALIGTVRRARYGYFAYGHHGYGRGFGYGHGLRGHCGPWQMQRSRTRWPLRWIFERLDTTPGQEKAIAKSLEELRDNVREGRTEIVQARKEVAEALGGDVLDQDVMKGALDRVEGLLQKTRAELTQTLVEVHTALDGSQRKELAELIAGGWPRSAHGYGRC